MQLCSCALFDTYMPMDVLKDVLGKYNDIKAGVTTKPLLELEDEDWMRSKDSSEKTGRVYRPSNSLTVELGGERANLEIPF